MADLVKKFCNAFISAFEYHKTDFVWTNDGVLKTSVMQSYIYPFIAKYLNLYLICELPADASYFDKKSVEECLKTGEGYPTADPVIIIEHENNYSRSLEEMEKLVKYNHKLNVLITYLFNEIQEQIKWLNNKFSYIIQKLEPSELKGRNLQTFLIILPTDKNYDPKINWVERWNFFVWNNQRRSFELLKI